MNFHRAQAHDEIPLAIDFQSVRRVDADGHMFVGRSLITAAQINPYYGREIMTVDPSLRLDPDRKYMLLRDPASLEAAIPSLHGKPLLLRHRSQTRGDYDPTVTIGSVMNPEWESPNVFAELSVVNPEGIRLIESGQSTDLSAGYRYRPEMEPGVYNGQAYDGRMIVIGFNHVTICPNGRVEGAMVGDEIPLPGEREMNTASYFRTLGEIENRVTARMAAIREAERDTALYTSGLAFDSAEKYYQAGLRAFGVPDSETRGIPASSLRVIWRRISARGAPTMAFDSAECSPVLNEILAGIPTPRDISMKGDRSY